MDLEPVVFVVEDDESLRTSVQRLLRSAGYATQACDSAEGFLRHPRPDRPCCAVVDVNLPGLSGLDLQHALVETCDPMPIIFITGRGDIPMSVRAMKAGAIDFLPKPFDAAELLSAVARAIRRSIVAQRERARITEIRRRYATLTSREREVLWGVVAGKLNKQIAGELGAGEKTVKVHRSRVMQKMKARSFAELVRIGLALGVAPRGNRVSDLPPEEPNEAPEVG